MEYTIHRSPRARHVWLRFNSAAELVVVVPHRFNVGLVPGIVEAQRKWIRRAVARAARRRDESGLATPSALPEQIGLPALGETWAVDYRETCSHRIVTVERSGGRLLVSGAVSDVEECRVALLRWLRRVARSRMAPRLAELAVEGGFPLRKVTVRSQRTRWASCSRGGAVSLNLRLLFVEPALARHVMLHELCHTIRMDHSAAFWALVERHDADWRAHRRLLRSEWKRLPSWLTEPLIPRR